MKIRIADRVLVALAGLVLLALCAAVIAQVFFAVPIFDAIGLFGGLFAAEEGKLPVAVIIVAAALLLVGAYCVCMLFRRRRGKRGFVLQQTENGELSIAIKAMEGLVHKCVECHPELKLVGTHLDPGKDGVTVDLRIALASGVSIPLAVGALQKQIRQYITACSGVDVKEVRVQVETTSDQVAESPYAVPELLQNPPALLREAESKPAEPVQVVAPAPAPAPVAPPVPVSPAVTAMPVVPAAPVPAPVAEPEAKDERPMHQRLFSIEEQPAMVPVPPTLETTAEETPAAEAPAEDAPALESAAEDKPAEMTEAPATEEAADEDAE